MPIDNDELEPGIWMVRKPWSRVQVNELAEIWFGNMVKVVADTRRDCLAIGGELHADAEALMIQDGSAQEDLWGANIYVDRPELRLEYTALINIRPGQGNRSMTIEDATVRERVGQIVMRLIQ